MRKTIITLAALTVGALGGYAASVALTPEPATPAPVSVVTSYDPFDQETFPCQEDEVLTFAPQFGPDRVGCVHYEDITG